MRKRIDWQDGNHYRTRNIFVRGLYLAYFVKNYGESVPLVYSVILSNTNTETGIAKVNDSLLMRQTCLSRPTVDKALDILSAYSLVEIRGKTQGKQLFEVIPLHEDVWKNILSGEPKSKKGEKTSNPLVKPLYKSGNLESPDNEENPESLVKPLYKLPAQLVKPLYKLEPVDKSVSPEKTETYPVDNSERIIIYNNYNDINKNISKNLFFLSELPEEEDDEEETVEEKKRRIVARIEPYRRGMSPEVYKETLQAAFQREGIK